MKAEYWALSHTGRVRKNNQDAFILDPGLGLSVLSDGVGGMARGEVASTIATRVVRQELGMHRGALRRYRGDPRQRRAIQSWLREAVQKAASEVFGAGNTLTPGRGMSCTLDAALVVGEELFLAHVGDSRVYRIRGDELTQLTDDHTVGWDKVRAGQIPADQATSQRGYLALTRALGALPSVKVDTQTFPIKPGDRFLMCSDGLTRHVPDEELPELLSGPGEAAVTRAVRIANQRGGKDNITALLVCFPLDGPAEVPVTATQLAELRTFAMFEAATQRELLILRRLLTTREVRPGTLLFREGEYGGEMFFLVEGEIAVTRSGHLLTKLQPGSAFGEMALLDEPLRSASALATRDSRLLALSRERFDRLLRQDDAVATRLLWGLLNRLSTVVRTQNKRYDAD